MDAASERNRAANKDGPLLIIITITYLSGQSQIIYLYFFTKIDGLAKSQDADGTVKSSRCKARES
jgi:hypothetical protein